MEVTVLNKTEQPERLICQAGRGDMFSGYVGDTEYAELMDVVDYNESDVRAVCSDEELSGIGSMEETHPTTVEAKTRSFIRKQASRGHWGIWEHPTITFAIEGLSVVTERQITRHRHLSFDVQSMRYVDFDDPPFAVPKSLRDEEHKTRSEGFIWKDMESDVPLEEQEPDTESMEDAHHIYQKTISNCENGYNAMRELGVPPEDARYALPLGTEVNVTMSGNARTMLHVLNLRQRPNAQWEIQELSEKIVAELRDWIPYTAEWWDDRGPVQISP